MLTSLSSAKFLELVNSANEKPSASKPMKKRKRSVSSKPNRHNRTSDHHSEHNIDAKLPEKTHKSLDDTPAPFPNLPECPKIEIDFLHANQCFGNTQQNEQSFLNLTTQQTKKTQETRCQKSNKKHKHNSSTRLVYPWTQLQFPELLWSRFQLCFADEDTAGNRDLAFCEDRDRLEQIHFVCKDILGTSNDIPCNVLRYIPALYAVSPMPKQWFQLQSGILKSFSDKIQTYIRNQNGYSNLSDNVVRGIMKEVSFQYRSEFTQHMFQWHTQMYQQAASGIAKADWLTHGDDLLDLASNRELHRECLKWFWMLWLGTIAKTSQIFVDPVLKSHQVRCKIAFLLTPFKLSKFQGLALNLGLIYQLQQQYPKKSADSRSVCIGSGSMFSRQSRVQKQCHKDILHLAQQCLNLNTSDKKKMLTMVTNWFDKASFDIADIKLDDNNN